MSVVNGEHNMAHSLKHKHQAVWLVIGEHTKKVYGVFSTKDGAEGYRRKNNINEDNDFLFDIRRWDVEFAEHECELI